MQLEIWAGPMADSRVIEGLEGMELWDCFPSGPLGLSRVPRERFQIDLRGKKLGDPGLA